MINDHFQLIKNSQQWQQQANLLSQISLTEDNVQQLNLQKNCEIIKMLYLDPRSKLIIAINQFLVEAIESYGNTVSTLALNLMRSDILFKLLGSSKNCVGDSINELIKSIVVNCPHSSYYTILAKQFNATKNMRIKQNISSYLLVLVDMIKCPKNFLSVVQQWRTDSNKQIKKNMQLLASMLSEAEPDQYKKQKKIVQESNKQNFPIGKSQQQTQYIHSSFLCEEEGFSLEDDLEFLMGKIKAEVEPWCSKSMAIEQLCRIVTEKALPDQYFEPVFGILTQLLDEKRSKIYLKSFHSMKYLIERYHTNFCKVLKGKMSTLISKSLKNQQIAEQIFEHIIKTDPIKNLTCLMQLTLQIKSMKQKQILLDLLAHAFCHYPFEPSKISTITKILCYHIQKQKKREIYLPCMVILSHFKVIYPKELLSCLLSQGNKIILKVIEIAEQIDPELRESLIKYIHGFKTNDTSSSLKTINRHQKYQMDITDLCDPLFQNNSPIRNDDQLNDDSLSMEIDGKREQILNLFPYMNAVKQQQDDDAVKNMAKVVFKRIKSVSVNDFFEIIKLTEKVTSESLLIDLELFLEQICKVKEPRYVYALFQAIQSCDLNSIEKQYIGGYLTKIGNIIEEDRALFETEHADRILRIYRASKCSRLRMKCIKLLEMVDQKVYEELITDKQGELIKIYREKNKSDI